MGIVNTLCTRKEKAVRHYYVNLIVKFFEGNSEITQRDGGEVECQLRTSIYVVWLDRNLMFVDRVEEGSGSPKFRLFCGHHKCMTSYQIHYSLSALLQLFSLFSMLSKRDNHNLKKKRGKTNLRINLNIHHTQVSFIWIRETQNKLSMTKKSCRACWIRLVQLNHIL